MGHRGAIDRRDALGLVLCALAGAAHAQPAARELTVAAFPQIDEIVRAVTPAWRLKHPEVRLKVVSRQFADHHTAMTTALSTSVLLPDVMALEAGYVGRFSAGAGLEVLSRPPYHAERLRDRFVSYAYEGSLNPQGEPVAVPTDIGPGTLLYRHDILARAGLSEADLIASWDGFVSAGTRLRSVTGAYLVAHAQAIKDILIRTGLRPGEGLFFDRDSRVLVESPRFARAFELAREVRRRKLDARVRAWSNEWAEAFRRGALATELSGAWMAGQMANWVAPDTRGLWRAAQLPGATHVGYGGTFYAIPRRAAVPQKALAWELIQLLTLDPARQLAAFKSQDAFPALVATHDDPFLREPLPFLGGQPARLMWRDAARRIGSVQVHKQDSFADEVIGTELDNVLDRGKGIAAALADAAGLLQRRARR